MQNIESKRETPVYHSYIEVQTPEEGLYKALRDFADGKLNEYDLRTLGNVYANSFPPFEFFNGRSGSEEYIEEYILEQVGQAKSPAEFARTELFQDIMTSPIVVDRFKKASPNVIGLTGNNDYPPYWPQEYRTDHATVSNQEAGWTVEANPEQVRSWRTRIRNLFRWN